MMRLNPARVGVIGLGGLLGLVLLVLAASAGLMLVFRQGGGPPTGSPSSPPPPQLEGAPGQSLGAVDARGRALLLSYAWTDGAHTRARIPIDRAMAILAQSGWREAAP